MFLKRQYWPWVALFFLALLVRLAYLFISIHTYGDGDLVQAISAADGYFTVSQNIIEGHGLTDSAAPPYIPYSFRPPLYHYFIAGAYWLLGGYWGVILLQILIASVLPLLGVAIARNLVERAWITWTSGVLLALEPSAVLYSTFFYAETFFMFWFSLSILLLFAYLRQGRLWQLMASGLLLGLATLTRPTTQFLPIVIMGAMLYFGFTYLTRRHILHILAYAAAFIIVLLPLLYRNYSIWGVADLSPQMGVNLHMTLLPTVYSIERGTTFQAEFAALEASGLKGPNSANLLEGKEYKKRAIPLLLAHPRALALSMLNSGLSFFTLDGVFDFLRHVRIRPPEMIGRPSLVALATDPVGVAKYFGRNIMSPLFFILMGRLLWIGITVAFIAEAIRRFWRPASLESRIAVLIVLYFALTALITGFGLSARYRLPVNALIVPLALSMIVLWWDYPKLTFFKRHA